MAKFDLREYARQGAQARAVELQSELAEIYRAFPDLRNAAIGRRGGAAVLPTGKRGRRRKGMTAAQRKAVSARMKKYWAARRKSNE